MLAGLHCELIPQLAVRQLVLLCAVAASTTVVRQASAACHACGVLHILGGDGHALSWPQAMVGAWEGQCGQLDQYGMQHSRTFANLCNAGVPVDMLAGAAAAACTPTPVPTS